MNIKKTYLEKIDNKEIIEYSLSNGKDLSLKILNLGCIIRELKFKGKNRVLGFASAEEYLRNEGHLGTVVGRVAGRISKGRIKIHGREYDLDKNEGSTCLHGGREGFASKVWDPVEEEVGEDYISLKFKYISRDGEAGFPGNLTVYTKYSLNRDNELIIEYFGESDKSTPISLTNHSYFNLNDDLNEGILDHILRIDADSYIRLDKSNIPVENVEAGGSPFDFRKNRSIGEYMDLSHRDLKNPQGYDHPFILNKKDKEEIYLKSQSSGVSLTIESTEPTVVLYTSNKLDRNLELSGGEGTFPYQGVCLETQWYSDGINQDFLPSYILEPGEKYYSRTSYRFTK